MRHHVACGHRRTDVLDVACENHPMLDSELPRELLELLFVAGIAEIRGTDNYAIDMGQFGDGAQKNFLALPTADASEHADERGSVRAELAANVSDRLAIAIIAPGEGAG